MKRTRNLAVFILGLLFLFSLMGVTAFAAEADSIELPEPLVKEEKIAVNDPGVGDNDELLYSYMQDSVSVSFEKKNSVFGRSHLSGLNLLIYQRMRPMIETVADGTEHSTQFHVSVKAMGLSGKFTAADLGVSSIVSNDAISQAAVDAMHAKFDTLSLKRVISTLLFDCPYELYWFDKTASTQLAYPSISAQYDSGTKQYVIFFNESTDLCVSLPVAQEYAAGQYQTDAEKIDAVQTTVETVQQIVTDNEEKSDLEKLKAYKDRICELVSYNKAAVNSPTAYGNPWQLIWVFDNDTSTNVVCEGYSKAFQFLCDASSFASDKVKSRIVTGTMSGGTGAGGHMWNVVTFEDGYNYLVDVTNCDTGTIGATDQLFLALRTPTSVTNGYVIACRGGNIRYVYDEDTLDSYSEEELAVADTQIENGTFQAGDYTYTVADGAAAIVAYSGNASDIVTPKTLGRYPVKTIREYAFQITYPANSLTVSEGIETIEYNGIGGSYHTISLPKSLKNVSTKAVEGEGGVSYSVGMGSFSVNGLETIRLNAENPYFVLYEGALYSKDMTYLVLFPNVCSSDTVVFPEGLLSIGDGACTMLSAKKVVLPDSLLYIGDSAFGQSSVEEINIPSHCEVICPWAFANTAITHLSLPATLVDFSGLSFDQMRYLESIDVDESATDYCSVEDAIYTLKNGVPDALVYCAQGKTGNLVIPDTVTAIQDHSLYSSKLSSIRIPASVVQYGATNFDSHLPELTIIGYTYSAAETLATDFGLTFQSLGEMPETVVSSGNLNETLSWTVTNTGKLTVSGTGDIPQYENGAPWNAYRDQIKQVTIGEGITSLADYLFTGYQSLRSVSLPVSLKKIGASAFDSCEQLNEAAIPDGVTEIGDMAFYGCKSLTVVAIPSKVETIGEKAFAMTSKLTGFDVDEDNLWFSSGESGELMNKAGTVLIQFPLGRKGSYRFPDSIQTIEESAFEWSEINELRLNDGLQTIKKGAFASCAVSTVILPSGVRTIGENAFAFCNNLKQLVFTGSAPQIGLYAFVDRSYEAFYPGNDPSWTEQMRQGYGGDVLWTAYDPDTTRFVMDAAGLYDAASEECGEGNEGLTIVVVGNIEAGESLETNHTIVIRKGLGLHVLDGVRIASAINNYGSISVESGGQLLTAKGNDKQIHNYGVISVAQGAALRTQQSNRILNNGRIDLNGDFYCGCIENNGEVQTLFTNTGEVYWGGPDCRVYLFNAVSDVLDADDVSSLQEQMNAALNAGTETAYEYGVYVLLHHDGVAATCEGSGSKEYWSCNETYYSDAEGLNPVAYDSLIISALGHDYQEVAGTAVASTCSKSGKQADKKCSRCNDVIEGAMLPLAEHSYGEWTTTKQPTCTETGSKEKVCATCQDKVTEEINALGHSWNEEYSVDTPATCTADGSESIHCSVCGASKDGTSRTIKKIAHRWNSGKVTKAATALSTGIRTYTCTVCGSKKTATIKKLTPTIKLSVKAKTIKRKQSFAFAVSKLAKGDSVKSLKVSKKGIVKIKKTKKNTYKITGIKKGKTIITVVLKSGKKAACVVKVK